MKIKHLSVVFAIVLVAAAVLLFSPKKISENGHGRITSTVTGEAGIGGAFALTNHKGAAVTDQTYAGKFMLVFFGFTYCPDICPADLLVMKNVMSQLSENEATQVVPIFITIDPARDTVEQLNGYLSNFHPAIQGLTGTQEQVDAAVKAYRVYAKKVQDEKMTEYTMDHSAYMYLMGRDGKYITHFQHNEKPELILTEIRKNLKG